jgi:hypothetical protein
VSAIHSTELLDVARADQAIGIIRRLTVAGDPSYRRFLRLMVGSVKIARMRAT